jgi:hypothetical protein
VGANATRITKWATDDKASGWLHGYWAKDWADCYRKLLAATPLTLNGTAFLNVTFEAQTHNDDNVDTHARFYGVNLLSELDAPSEYFIDEDKLLLYFMPPVSAGAPASWVGTAAPVLSINTSALVAMDGVSHMRLEGLVVVAMGH